MLAATLNVEKKSEKIEGWNILAISWLVHRLKYHR